MTQKQLAELTWNKKMHFTGSNGHYKIEMDAAAAHAHPGEDGDRLAPTPKDLILQAMMGCSAMDVVSTLEKMRQPIDAFTMKIEAEKNQHPPIYFKSSLIRYYLKGNIAPEKAIKALDASLTKYCGVNYMISKAGKIFFELYLNEQLINKGQAQFHEPLAD